MPGQVSVPEQLPSRVLVSDGQYAFVCVTILGLSQVSVAVQDTDAVAVTEVVGAYESMISSIAEPDPAELRDTSVESPKTEEIAMASAGELFTDQFPITGLSPVVQAPVP